MSPFWVVFAISFALIAEWETRARRRPLVVPERRRFVGHITLMALGHLALWAVVRLSPIALALFTVDNPYGLLNRPWIPVPLAWFLTVVLLDLSRYAMHWVHHRIPLLWRLHKVHHSDPDIDVSTALRFHPIDLFVIEAGHLATVALLAPPPGAVVLSACIACFQNFYSHANAALPERVEAWLRRLFVTPEMHRIHHSVEMREQNANFGDVFSTWDRLFRTHLAQPAAGHAHLETGLRGIQASESLKLSFLLGLPFGRLGDAVDVKAPTAPSVS